MEKKTRTKQVFLSLSIHIYTYSIHYVHVNTHTECNSQCKVSLVSTFRGDPPLFLVQKKKSTPLDFHFQLVQTLTRNSLSKKKNVSEVLSTFL